MLKRTTTIVRASSMLGALSAVVVGATFALTPVTATLTDSTLTAASASLRVDGPDENTAFGADDPGFTFTELFPGSANWSAPQDFALKNVGTTDLKVAVAATGATGTLDPTKVTLKITNTSEGNSSVEYTLDQLATAKDLPGVSDTGSLEGGTETPPAEGETDNFTVQVKLAEGASGSLNGLDLVFTGTPVDETPAPTPEED